MALASETSSIDIQRKIDRKRDGLITVRAAAALTAAYVATDHIDCSQAENINVYFKLTWTASTSIEYYIEWSYDATTWYRSSNVSPSGAVNTLTANNQTIAVTASINWVDTFKRQGTYMRVQVKETGATDTLAIFAQATSL